MKCISTLLDAGANPNIPCRDSRDVFMYAIHEYGDERLDILKYLYNEGGIKERVNRKPLIMSVLHKALLAKKRVKINGVIQMLVEGGENVNALEGKER